MCSCADIKNFIFITRLLEMITDFPIPHFLSSKHSLLVNLINRTFVYRLFFITYLFNFQSPNYSIGHNTNILIKKIFYILNLNFN